MSKKIVFLPGDGIGPEVTKVVRSVLDTVANRFNLNFSCEDRVFGGAAIDECGDPLPNDTLNACKAADAVFLGAVGGPQWDNAPKRPEAGLLGIRKALGLYANLRPIHVHPALAELSPLKTERVRDVDFLIVRELTGGIYFGKKTRTQDFASDLCTYSTGEIERIARTAFEAARKRRGKVTSIDKANVMETGRLWREVVERVHQADYVDIALDHVLVDAAAMKLIQTPKDFDVIVTENMFGDILSDEASVLAGSIGLLGSASLGSLGDEGPGLFEPIHGSAPDIAGQDKANPLGALASLAMMLRFGLDLNDAADAVEAAINTVIEAGELTVDIGGQLGCKEAGQRVAGRIASGV